MAHLTGFAGEENVFLYGVVTIKLISRKPKGSRTAACAEARRRRASESSELMRKSRGRRVSGILCMLRGFLFFRCVRVSCFFMTGVYQSDRGGNGSCGKGASGKGGMFQAYQFIF